MSLITWNPLDKDDSITLSNNNLTVESTAVRYGAARTTIGKSFGKWYFEIKIDSNVRLGDSLIGVAPATASLNHGTSATSFSSEKLYRGNSRLWAGDIHYDAGTWQQGDAIGVILDMDEGTLAWTRNGTRHSVGYNNLLEHDEVFPYVIPYGYSDSFTANFGATEFDIITSNPEVWEQLQSEGYKPYDIENATWLFNYKHLIKSNNQIYTLNQDSDLIQPTVSNPPTKEDFETYGLDSLTGLMTPKHRVTLSMEDDRLEGEGKVFSKKVTPSKWSRMIAGMKVK